MVKASVIVPARNAVATLPRTLEALTHQDFEGAYEVLVIDDGSTDGTADLARSFAPLVRTFSQPASGPAVARNRGVAESAGPALAFCDSDVFPTASWLSAGVVALVAADLVQGHVLPDPGTTPGPFDRTLWITHEVGLYETASLFVTREVFDRVGGFEEWIRPAVGKALAEDVWFGWRARRLGAATGFCEGALAHHAVFERHWREYAGERRRLAYFPAMAAKMPELRRHFFYRRMFLNRRTASLDLSLVAALAAVILRSPLPLAAAVPYARLVAARARSFGGVWAAVASADVAADLVGLAALFEGSVRYRSPLI